MLTFEVDGKLPGAVLPLDGKKTVTARVKARSLLPFGRLEIIVNGKVVEWKVLPEYYTDRDIYELDLETEIPLSVSTWISGRVTSQNTPGILPRGLTVFAHTNPVYYLSDGKPVHVARSVDYLLTYQKAVRNWIEMFSNFSTNAEKKEARKYLEEAEKVLKARQ
jgi:hypothetical protein